MGVAYHTAPYSAKIHAVTAYSYHCHRVTTDHELVSALSMVMCPWNWQTPSKHWHKWHLNLLYTWTGMELAHNQQHCSHALMYIYIHITHTCCSWSGTSWAAWYVHFPPLSSAGERPLAAEGSQPLWDIGLLGKERVSQGDRSILALVRQNIVQQQNL